MGLAITGQVSGRMLAGAMLRAQAVTPGNLSQKQTAGVGFLLQHLNSNATATTEWQRVSPRLSPEQVIARASVNSGWLEEAGKHIEAATDPKIRAGLLEKIITPHLRMSASLFGDVIGRSAPKPQEIKLEEISHVLELQLPEIELTMCSIPGGKFSMGSSENADEKFTDGKSHLVELSAFDIGTYEVTVAQYQRYLELTGAAQPEYWDDSRFGKGKLNHPVVGVNWNEAMAFAKWLGLNLATEAQGEFAARAWGKPDENEVYQCREYPWGDTLDLSKVTFNTDGTRPVNAHSEGASFFKVMDLSGNVWEWRKDWYDGKGYNPLGLLNPQGSSQGTSKVLRGGSWSYALPDYLRCASRYGGPPEFRNIDIGFRVAEDKK